MLNTLILNFEVKIVTILINMYRDPMGKMWEEEI